MISVHCRMVAELLRRAHGKATPAADTTTVSTPRGELNVNIDSLGPAVDALTTSFQRATHESRHVSPPSANKMDVESNTPKSGAIVPRKRGRPRKSDTFIYTHYDTSTPNNSSFYTTAPGSNAHGDLVITPPTKRRGRPPRDLGSELYPTFSLYVNEHYATAETHLNKQNQESHPREPGLDNDLDPMTGGDLSTQVKPISKDSVISWLWNQWWHLPQIQKDHYLNRARSESRARPEFIQNLVAKYPLPAEAIAQVRAVAINNVSTSRNESPMADIILTPTSAAAATTTPTKNHNTNTNDVSGNDQQQQRPSSSSAAPQEEASTPDPYTLFCHEQMPRVSKQFPDWTVQDIERRLAIQWNNMEEEELKRYESDAKALAQKAGSGSATFVGYTGSASWTKARGGSRRAYVLYCRYERPTIVRENVDWDLPEVNKELGRRWKEMPHDEKEKYFAMERAESGYHTNDDMSRSGSPVPTPKSAPLVRQPQTPLAHKVDHHPKIPLSHPLSPRTYIPGKGPSRAYILFSRLTRSSIVKQHSDFDLAAINRELGRMWKEMTSEERTYWEDKAKDTPAKGSTPESRSKNKISGFGAMSASPQSDAARPANTTTAVSYSTTRENTPFVSTPPSITQEPSSPAPFITSGSFNDNRVPPTDVSSSNAVQQQPTNSNNGDNAGMSLTPAQSAEWNGANLKDNDGEAEDIEVNYDNDIDTLVHGNGTHNGNLSHDEPNSKLDDDKSTSTDKISSPVQPTTTSSDNNNNKNNLSTFISHQDGTKDVASDPTHNSSDIK